jgi:hypothetical protein
MFKMNSHDPFGHLKHKLWPKERLRVKLTVWFLTIKSRELTDFLTCRWCATNRWKVIDEGYNFVLDLISIRGLHTKLWKPKSRESQLWEFSDSHLGVSGQNVIWMWASWRDTEYTIRGKVMTCLRALMSLVSSSLLMTHLSTKSAPAMQ